MSRRKSRLNTAVMKVLYLLGLLNEDNRKRGPSSFNFGKILEKVNDLMVNEELFRSPSLTINQLARRVGTNRTYLSKCFHLHNTNYVDYINEYRLKYSKSLMEKMGGEIKSITEVSELSGFPNPRSFSCCFTKRFGKTPSQFKRELLAGSTPPRF